MAQTLMRFAASLGIVAGFTVAGGLGAAVAIAEPGSYGSPASHSREGTQSRGDGGEHRGRSRGSNDGDRRSSNDGDRSGPNGGDRRGSNDGDRSGSNDGDRRGERQRDTPRRSARPAATNPRGGANRSTPVVAGRGTSTTPVARGAATTPVAAVAPSESKPAKSDPAESKPAESKPALSDPAESDPTPAIAAIPPRSAARGTSGGSSGGSSLVRIEAVPPTSGPPQAVFGDGRTPGLGSDQRGGPPRPGDGDPTIVLTAGAAQEPPRPPPPLLPAPRAPSASSSAAVPASSQLVQWAPETLTTSLWGRVRTDWPASLIFGIAGLLLAPIGGIWLGQRQARRSKAASELVSS